MSADQSLHTILSMVQLETRELLSTTLWSETFESLKTPQLPVGWSNWSSSEDELYITSSLAARDSKIGLASLGNSRIHSRFWNNALQKASTGITVDLRSDSAAPYLILIQGKNLDTTKPSYLGVEVSRFAYEVVEVVEGQRRSLQKYVDTAPPSSSWINIAFVPNGKELTLTVKRHDNGQFLTNQGWKSTASNLFTFERNSFVTGQVGVGRGLGGLGMAYFDNIKGISQEKQTPAADTGTTFRLNADWQGWSNTPRAESAIKNDTLSILGQSNNNVHLWYQEKQAADTEISSVISLNSLIDTGIYLRGENLGQAEASYYALAATRGGTFSISLVDHGQETILQSIRTQKYISQEEIKLYFKSQGSLLTASIQRVKTGEWLNQIGAWQSEKTAALSTSNLLLTHSGHVGIFRQPSHWGLSTFKDFTLELNQGRVDSNNNLSRTDIIHKYDHIRIAALAYSGTPYHEFAQQLTKESLDLIIANPRHLEAIAQADKRTQRVVYTNLSNIYEHLLTSWLHYADKNAVSREVGFYHVKQPTAYQGSSAASIPVNQFWSVNRGGITRDSSLTDFTSAALGRRHFGVQLGGTNEALYIGYPEQFRELNITLTRKAQSPWQGVWEYATTTDSLGRPGGWKELKILSDTTAGSQRSGQILFDPPADWVGGQLHNTTHYLHYIRLRTISGTASQAPEWKTLFGRDFVEARGRDRGTIPAFDSVADADKDGYLSDQEYRQRRAGFDARFVYESRLFYPYYGPMRYLVNPASQAIKNWAAQYHTSLLQQNSLINGFFIDNSNGTIPISAGTVLENTQDFSDDYAKLLRKVSQAVAPAWTVSNTFGSFNSGDNVAQNSTAVFEEFVLRPNSVTWSGFQDVARLVENRLKADSPSPYIILDTHPGNASTTDPKTQLGALSYYYLLAEAQSTFISFFGGHNPSADWKNTWVPAAAYDVGEARGKFSVWAEGQDPSNTRLHYKVYGREYENALVLFKPISYALGAGAGQATTASNTTHQLQGLYRELRADGSLGNPLRNITLSNAQGAILIKVGS